MDERRIGRCQDGTTPAAVWHSDHKGQRRYALACCRLCPLLEPCREYALFELILETGVKVICGGLTETQIREYRRWNKVRPPARLVSESARRAARKEWAAKTRGEPIGKPFEIAKRANRLADHMQGLHARGGVEACPRCERESAVG